MGRVMLFCMFFPLRIRIWGPQLGQALEQPVKSRQDDVHAYTLMPMHL